MLSNFDQPVRLTEQETQIFKEVDDVVSRSITIGDPILAFEYGSHLRRKQTVEGLALAKLLYRINEGWDLFRSAGIDDDMVTMAQTEMGVAPETTRKYIRMWESIFENENIEESVKRVLMGRPIGDLLLLTAAAREGSLSGEELHEAALTPDRSSLREIIRQKRGEHTSSVTAIRIYVQMVDSEEYPAGTIYAKRGNERVRIGQFFPAETELAEKAITSIMNARGIVEVYSNG